MLGKQNRTGQFSLYQTRLDTLVNMNNPLSILATEIDWSSIVQRTPPQRDALRYRPFRICTLQETDWP